MLYLIQADCGVGISGYGAGKVLSKRKVGGPSDNEV